MVRENFHYNTKPIGGGNPYYQCDSCGQSDPQVSISGHRSNCEYRALHAMRPELERLLAQYKKRMGSSYYIVHLDTLKRAEQGQGLLETLNEALGLLEGVRGEDLEAARELADELWIAWMRRAFPY